MKKLLLSAMCGAALLASAGAHAQLIATEARLSDTRELFGPSLMTESDAFGLPGLRPRLTMAIPLQRHSDPERNQGGPFSWSLNAWQLNTASLAHIQCNRLTSTIDSYLAEDCRFVDQPVPESAVNLVQVRGEWTAAPGLSVGIGAFSLSSEPTLGHHSRNAGWASASELGRPATAVRPTEGVDFNISFGIEHDRVGDFLVGLQLARYKQTMSLLDMGFGRFADLASFRMGEFERYANSAQLALGWRRGSFSSDLLASSREVPLYLGGSQYGMAPLNSFDLEFSWRAVRNTSISVGVSNILDASPRAAEDMTLEPGMDDPLESIFGRIPYVRFKHDL
ncbi:MAG: hypothetical protein ACXIUM_13720 [Wenzhouxiangella sp.]